MSQSQNRCQLAIDSDSAFLAAIARSRSEALIGCDLSGNVKSWNPGAELLYGYSAREVLGRQRSFLFSPDTNSLELAVWYQTLNGVVTEPFQTTRFKQNGASVCIWTRYAPILNSELNLVGISDLSSQIISQASSERALAQLAAIVDSSDDAIIGKSIDNGTIQSWNLGAERLYGYQAVEVIGRPMSSLLPPSLYAEEKSILEKIRRGERVEHFDTERIHKDGRTIQVSLSISPIRNTVGQVIGVSHVARDISETKKLKDKLQASQKMEALGRLAGGVAHDFNNLLTVISGYGSLLRAGMQTQPEYLDMADEVLGAAQRASELTRQLLVFSRNQVIHLQPVDLKDVLEATLGMLRRLIGEDVSIDTRLTPNLPRIQADAGQIGQILMNLSANARDSMPNGGKIIIQTESWIVQDDEFHQQLDFCPGSYVRLLFSDTGSGMDAATQSRIFEPFFTTKEVGSGTGLGLATVYGIVRQYGGQISVYSEVGRGTTFAIYFPCTGEVSPSFKTTEVPVGKGSETVLLVEDEPSIRKLASAVLRGSGYTVLSATNADEALLCAEQHAGAIQVMLTDIVMPGRNGQELAVLLREQRPDTRVVFMSGYTEHETLARIRAQTDTIFLQKPFTPDQLLRKLREALS